MCGADVEEALMIMTSENAANDRNSTVGARAGEPLRPAFPAEGVRSVILIGNPNVGKSVLFTRLTGQYVVISNYPGTTVEVARGNTTGDGEVANCSNHSVDSHNSRPSSAETPTTALLAQ